MLGQGAGAVVEDVDEAESVEVLRVDELDMQVVNGQEEAPSNVGRVVRRLVDEVVQSRKASAGKGK